MGVFEVGFGRYEGDMAQALQRDDALRLKKTVPYYWCGHTHGTFLPPQFRPNNFFGIRLIKNSQRNIATRKRCMDGICAGAFLGGQHC